MFREGQAPALTINRADYTAPAYWIDTVDLCFDLGQAKTCVLNKRLDGDELNLSRVLVNGQGTFKIEGSQLVLNIFLLATSLLIWRFSPPPTHQKTPS